MTDNARRGFGFKKHLTSLMHVKKFMVDRSYGRAEPPVGVSLVCRLRVIGVNIFECHYGS